MEEQTQHSANQADLKIFLQIYETLQRLTGLHRQLMDTVRMEREALVAADIKGIEDATLAKQALIEAIQDARAGATDLSNRLESDAAKRTRKASITVRTMLEAQWENS